MRRGFRFTYSNQSVSPYSSRSKNFTRILSTSNNSSSSIPNPKVSASAQKAASKGDEASSSGSVAAGRVETPVASESSQKFEKSSGGRAGLIASVALLGAAGYAGYTWFLSDDEENVDGSPKSALGKPKLISESKGNYKEDTVVIDRAENSRKAETGLQVVFGVPKDEEVQESQAPKEDEVSEFPVDQEADSEEKIKIEHPEPVASDEAATDSLAREKVIQVMQYTEASMNEPQLLDHLSIPHVPMPKVEADTGSVQAGLVGVLMNDTSSADSDWKKQVVQYVQKMEEQKQALSNQVDVLRRELLASLSQRDEAIRAHYEAELTARLRRREHELSNYLAEYEAVVKRTAEIQIRREVSNRSAELLANQQDILQAFMEELLSETNQLLQTKNEQLAAVHEYLENYASELGSVSAHRQRLERHYQAALVTARLEKLASGHCTGMASEIAELSDASDVNDIVRESVRILQDSGLAAHGAWSTELLCKRLDHVASLCLRTEMVPPGGSFWLHLSAAIADWLRWNPKGSGAEDDDGTSAILERARQLASSNNLAAAADELDTLPIRIRPITSEWIREARDRALLDQTIHMLGLEMTLQARI